jgi:broad specificity phosphatase PhoE
LRQEIFLLRHGETEWNAAGRFQGILDSPLTERGIAQANACGMRLAEVVNRPCEIFTSPLGRARQTCEIIRSCGSYPQARFDGRLQEVTVGSWDGLTHIDIEGMWPGLLDGSTPFDWYFRSPDGESFEAALSRASLWLSEADGVVIAVSHGLFGRIIRGAYLGLSMDQALTLPVPQDVIWHLRDGDVTGIQA